MNNPLIWFLNQIKLLKNKFYFNNEISIQYYYSEELPNVVDEEVDGKEGSILLSPEGLVFVKQDNGATNNWNPIGAGGGGIGGGVLLDCKIYTDDDLYLKNEEATYIIVEAVGGGGGGGSAHTASTSASEGGSGGGGEYGLKVIQNALIDNDGETIVIGDGGAGGINGTSNGANGGTTSFGTHLTAVGGGGGTNSAAGNGVKTNGGDGGTGGTGADFYFPGGDGMLGNIRAGSPVGCNFSGKSFLSEGINAPIAISQGLAGITGTGFGTGGTGACVSSAVSTQVGGDGAKGVVIVWEYK
jgi:hypothetical protein